MKPEDLELKIFYGLDELKQFIKKNFNTEEVEEIEHEEDTELDDEIAFCWREYDCSVYYMTGKSGRVIVVEVNKQHY